MLEVDFKSNSTPVRITHTYILWIDLISSR